MLPALPHYNFAAWAVDLDVLRAYVGLTASPVLHGPRRVYRRWRIL